MINCRCVKPTADLRATIIMNRQGRISQVVDAECTNCGSFVGLDKKFRQNLNLKGVR